MNADGTNQINLSNYPSDDNFPVWSPDGSRIAFVSTRDDDDVNRFERIDKVYVMNADGTDQRLLIDAESRWPSWSPDGTKIAFMYFQESTLPPELHILDLLSQTETVLDTTVEFDGKVAWSPDGEEILFMSYALVGFIAIEREHGQLYRMSATGSVPIQITFGASNGYADWKGTIASPAIPTSEIEDSPTVEAVLTSTAVEIENTATAEATLPPTIIETSLPTDVPEPVSTETIEPTAPSEVEDTATAEATLPPAIIETLTFTDMPETEPIETP